MRTPIKIIWDKRVSVTLISFFQKENVNWELLPFKIYLFELTLCHCLKSKILEAKNFNARLEAFHVASLSWLGCSQEFLLETVKQLGVRQPHLECTRSLWNTSIRSDLLTANRGNNLKVHKMTANKKNIDFCFFCQTLLRTPPVEC